MNWESNKLSKFFIDIFTFIKEIFGATGVIVVAILLIAILWGILILLPIIGWAIALILTIVIIISLVSFMAGRKSKSK